MPIAFDVRIATDNDYDDLLRLNKALFEYEYDQGFSDSHNREWTYGENGKKAFRTYLEKPNARAWIATNEHGDAVGYLAAYAEKKSYRTTIVAEIENMYIDEGYRCTGIGRTLVENFKTWAFEQDAGIARVGAMVDNKHAREFYEKWGFSEAEVIYEMRVKDEA